MSWKEDLPGLPTWVVIHKSLRKLLTQVEYLVLISENILLCDSWERLVVVCPETIRQEGEQLSSETLWLVWWMQFVRNTIAVWPSFYDIGVLARHCKSM